MKYISFAALLLFACTFSLLNFSACSKSSPDPAPGPTNPCAGITITLLLTPTHTSGCANDGGILATASGSSGFTYKLNAAGTYQATGTFNNLPAGNYTVFAKDANGCEQSTTVTINTGVKGPLFTQVRNLLTAKCQTCHNNTVQNGGMNWEVDCNIVTNKARIKVRAVDEGTMPFGGPELSASEKAVITNWINGGGRLTD